MSTDKSCQRCLSNELLPKLFWTIVYCSTIVASIWIFVSSGLLRAFDGLNPQSTAEADFHHWYAAGSLWNEKQDPYNYDLFRSRYSQLTAGKQVRSKAGYYYPPQASVDALLMEEAGWGVDQFAFYQNFGGKVENLRVELLALLKKTKAEGKRIAVYGASAKSATLLNYYDIGREMLEYVVDRSTAKQGRFTSGTHFLIRSTDALLEDRPDYVLLLTWNFADEILAQQAAYRRLGGKFIIPIPKLKVVQA